MQGNQRHGELPDHRVFSLWGVINAKNLNAVPGFVSEIRGDQL